jgi:hypothetical protein
MLTGTELENQNYTYYGDIVYSDFIQPDIETFKRILIPFRSSNAVTGSVFMESIKDLSFEDRENKIFEEICSGNIPYFSRVLREINFTSEDNNGLSHTVKALVMPDYLAIGSDEDFCRVPMGPLTAQKLADFFEVFMPTRKLVDKIHDHAEIRLSPVTYAPVGHENEKVEKFIEHNKAIEELRDGQAGIIDGIKKDVILSNKISSGYVVIYGWYQLNGKAIQPLYSKHYDSYVDYSHGIRLLSSNIYIDGVQKNIKDVLQDSKLYKLISDEEGIMIQPTYIPEVNL